MTAKEVIVLSAIWAWLRGKPESRFLISGLRRRHSTVGKLEKPRRPSLFFSDVLHPNQSIVSRPAASAGVIPPVENQRSPVVHRCSFSDVLLPATTSTAILRPPLLLLLLDFSYRPVLSGVLRLFQLSSMVLIQANISYEIPDDGTVAQQGQLIPGNIPIIAVPLCQDFINIQNQSAMQIDRMGFLRCYYVDFEKGYILYAPWEETLSEWLLGRKVYVPYRPRGFPNDAYRVSTALKEFIRVMLFAMVHLHQRNHCFDRDFGVNDVVVSEGMPKFKGVGVRKKASELDRTRDFGNFRALVKHQVLGGGVAAHCPRDMIHFLGLLRHPRVDSMI